MERLDRLYGWIRSRIMEGTLDDGPEVGVAAITSMRVMKRWGVPPIGMWDFKHDSPWPPPPIPREMDAIAKGLRAFRYGRVVGIDEARNAIRNGQGFGVCVPVTPQWQNPAGGRVETPKAWEETDELHAVTVVGYDDARSEFRFANWWGADWGDQGYGYLPYDYWLRFSTDSWTTSGVAESHIVRRLHEQHDELYEHNWTLCALSGVGYQHGWIVHDPVKAIEAAWAFATDRHETLDVEELYVRERYRGRGLARGLARILVNFGYAIGRPARFWVTHYDDAVLGPGRLDLADGLGLQVAESGVPWAARLLVSRDEQPPDNLPSPALGRPAARAGSHLAWLAQEGSTARTDSGAVLQGLADPDTDVLLDSSAARQDPSLGSD